MVMTGDETITSDLIKLIIDKRHTLMCTVDEHWPVIEGYWESIITQGHSARFNAEIIVCLPHAGNAITPDESVRKLIAFKTGKMMNLAGLGMQSQVQTIIDAVLQIKNKRNPDIATDGSLLMKRIGLIMCHWCRSTDHGADIRGKKAVLAIYAKIEEAIKEGGMQNIKPVDIEPLLIFRYSLGLDQQENVIKWAEDLMAMRGSFARTAEFIAAENQSTTDQAQEDICATTEIDERLRLMRTKHQECH